MKNALITILLLLIPLCAVGLAVDHKPITIVYNRGIAPIKFTDGEGRPSGILNEYWVQLAKKSGLNLKFREVKSFDQSMDLVRRGDADLHAGLFFTQERSQFLEYSLPVFDLKYFIYSTSELEPLTGLEKTKGFLIGIVQGGLPEKQLKKAVPIHQIIVYKDYASMFKAALNGEIKIFISSDIHLNYYLSVNHLDNPFMHGEESLLEQTYYGATAKKNTKLIENIKQGQHRLTKAEKQQLKDRWLNFKVGRARSPVIKTLTDQEIEWIKHHPVLKVSNELDWPPFDFNVSGKPMGLSIELLEIISRRINIKFEYVHGYSWNELLAMMRNKQLDIVHSLNRSAERDEFILFTDHYLSNQTVIITAQSNTSIWDVKDLENKRVAVIDGYNQKQVLKDHVENIQLISVGSPLEALKAVSSGRADATIRFNGVATYLFQNHLLTNLKFVNEFKIKDDGLDRLHLGVRNDQPILKEILQKALASITHEEMNALKSRWISFKIGRSKTPRIDLTEEERNWIGSHPEIKLGADYNWPPFDFAGSGDVHEGLAADYIKLIERRTGLKVKVKTGVWSEIMALMKSGHLDGLGCAVQTEERNKYLYFSTPYLSVPTVIVVRNDDQVTQSMADLSGKTVSINNGSYVHEWIKGRYPDIKLHLSTSNEASVEAVSYGRADAYIGNIAVANYTIRKKLLTNLKVVKSIDSMVTKPAVAIDRSQPILMGIIEKVLDSITLQEHQSIRNKWYVASTEQKVALTNLERKWLNAHPVVRITGNPGWAPLSFRDDNGEYAGIVPDFFKLIKAKTDINFEVIEVKNWSHALRALNSGAVDAIDAIPENPERRKMFDFTDTYLAVDLVFVTRDDIKFIRGLDQVGQKIVATVKDYVTESYIRKDHPDVSLELYENVESGLKALSSGLVDVFVIDIPSFEHYARKSSLPNLKISGLTSWKLDIGIGVRKGQPELISILNKALGTITPKEQNGVYDSWVTLKEPLIVIDYSLLIKAALAACVCLLAIGYWNRRLSHEVSLRKTAEEKALKASMAKSDFLANMSHEIRTPMNSVLGFAELMDNMISDPIQKSYIKAIRTGGKTLLGIINDILDLSKIEAGMMKLKPEPVSMPNLFEEMEKFFKNRVEQKQLVFVCELDPDFPPYILIDSIRLRQILINLIGNALKFTEKGRIELRAGDLHSKDDAQHIGFTITVADTGIGIPEDQLNLIFDKFQQQESQDNMRYGGTGLGLSICKSLTRMMGGILGVASTVSEGSAFKLKFNAVPIAEPGQEEAAEQKLAASGFQEANVLVVDDVEDNRTLIVEHFRESKIQFFQAANGVAAMKTLEKIPIDLILLDLRMPVMNGYETITAIKNSDRHNSIPVIAITASVMGRDLKKVDQYGFDGYLRKPIGFQDLLQLTAKHLPYEASAQTEEAELVPWAVDMPAEQLEKFLSLTDAKLLPQWREVKDRGDFELITQFADDLKAHATRFSLQRLILYADQLQQHVASFDIIEVDGMMKQFPKLIQVLNDNAAREDITQ